MAYYFAVESITSAMRAQDILRKSGIKSQVIRTFSKTNQKGCGFSVLVYSSPEKARNILEKNGIKILSSYQK